MTYEEAKRVISNACIRFGRAQGKTLFLKAMKMAMEALDKQIQGEAMKNKLALEAKYTDDDVIKAAECCSKFDDSTTPLSCDECPFKNESCSKFMSTAVSDLLKRQKSEIERLQKYNADVAFKHYNDGIKDYAERLKAELTTGAGTMRISVLTIIDDLVKEMIARRGGRK